MLIVNVGVVGLLLVAGGSGGVARRRWLPVGGNGWICIGDGGSIPVDGEGDVGSGVCEVYGDS